MVEELELEEALKEVSLSCKALICAPRVTRVVDCLDIVTLRIEDSVAPKDLEWKVKDVPLIPAPSCLASGYWLQGPHLPPDD